MKTRACMLAAYLLLFPLTLLAQETPPPQEVQTTQESAPSPRPRVPGQPQTDEEWNTWQLVIQAPTVPEQAELARKFLEKYPGSGLTSNAHYFIARSCYESNDVTNFVFHAERALEELPYSVDFLSQLAFIYAEQGESEKAKVKATAALQVLDRLRKSEGTSSFDWLSQVHQMKAEALYALGRASVNDAATADEEGQRLNFSKALHYLRQALEFDPRHDYAALRIGFVERNLGNVDGALKSYGRAVAAGRVAASTARAQIDEILRLIKKAAPESDWAKRTTDEIVAEAVIVMQEAVARKQAELTQLAEEMDSNAAQPKEGQPAPPGSLRSPSPPSLEQPR